MVGIHSYGVYVPRYRLNRTKIFEAMGWINPMNVGFVRGEKAVANYDEDSITMAVTASMNCLIGVDRFNLGGVYFASTTMPYQERQNAGIITGALGMRDDVRTADFTGALKSGTTALISAIEGVESKGVNNLVVCSSDCRLGKMGSTQEMIFGDGGAAFLISDHDLIAEYKGSFSLSFDFVDRYRGRFEQFDRQWEDRWIRDLGFEEFIPRAINGLLDKFNMKIEDFAKVIYPCHYSDERKKLNKKLCLEADKVQDPMFEQIGDVGTAQTLMMLAKALDEANPGDKILVISFGSGCDALYFEVTKDICNRKSRKNISSYMSNKTELDKYEKYLAWRHIIPVDLGLRGDADVSTRWSIAWRKRKAVLGFCGTKCIECGTPQFPPQRICVNPDCGAIDQMEEYYFSDKIGRIFSYTGDNLAASLNPPHIYGYVTFEGGGKFMMNFADCSLQSLYIGMPVYPSFRIKMQNEKRGITGYFWKVVPLTEE
jgi:3-hydroxy-3-methylglutaryl CoA synthase/uncharacterized OB-fold protein